VKEEIPCQFKEACIDKLYDPRFCNNPDIYNGLESECPVYYDCVKALIHKDKYQYRLDKYHYLY
jgi:hypothetical protein